MFEPSVLDPVGADERRGAAQTSGRPQGLRETPGGPVDAASLAIFRDFVNGLDFEDRGGGGNKPKS